MHINIQITVVNLKQKIGHTLLSIVVKVMPMRGNEYRYIILLSLSNLLSAVRADKKCKTFTFTYLVFKHVKWVNILMLSTPHPQHHPWCRAIRVPLDFNRRCHRPLDIARIVSQPHQKATNIFDAYWNSIKWILSLRCGKWSTYL